MEPAKLVCMISYALVIIGALAWGALGFFNYDLVGMTVGPENAVYVYDLVGIAAIILIVQRVMKYQGMKSII
jgi:uncharacterized membrane protein YuzA (DUF378 family)